MFVVLCVCALQPTIYHARHGPQPHQAPYLAHCSTLLLSFKQPKLSVLAGCDQLRMGKEWGAVSRKQGVGLRMASRAAHQGFVGRESNVKDNVRVAAELVEVVATPAVCARQI